MGSNPSYFKGPQRPVERVSWEDAVAYGRAVGVRLPTEAEWEYAARAGGTAARDGELDEVAWYDKNSQDQTHDVKLKRPNAWGLYDTLGNVREWTADGFDEKAYADGEARDPRGPVDGRDKVVRGGSWALTSCCARVSYRVRDPPSLRSGFTGFRCAGN